MRRFNINGVCNSELHYMVDTSAKVNQIAKMVNQGDYFTINRARQYGKTTTLSILEKQLKSTCVVLYVSFEGYGDRIFSDEILFIDEFINDVSDRLYEQSIYSSIVNEWKSSSSRASMKNLSRKITQLCKEISKPVVLMIDEVDKTSNNQLFLDFLGMLRNKYIDRSMRNEATFQSVILAGVYDIKNIKLKLRSDEQRSYNSPWNIAASFNIDMSFSPREIATMLNEYESDHHTGMSIAEISDEIHRYTSGYPYLVSDICKIIDEQLHRDWTIAGVHRAVGEVLREKTPLFESIIKNLQDYPELNSITESILLSGETVLYNIDNRDIDLGVTFGLFKRGTQNVEFYNTIFETRIYNYMISINKLKTTIPGNPKYIENGRLNMERVLLKFQELMKSEYRSRDGEFLEKQGRLLFLCFLKPIINGTGHYTIEGETRDSTRMDIQVLYGSEEHIVELKIWHGGKMNDEAREQLYGYLSNRHQRRGYLVSFSFVKSKEYRAEWVKIGDKDIFEVVV